MREITYHKWNKREQFALVDPYAKFYYFSIYCRNMIERASSVLWYSNSSEDNSQSEHQKEQLTMRKYLRRIKNIY